MPDTIPISTNKVRPGRVDDLVLAIIGKVVEQKASPFVQGVFLEAQPVLEAVAKAYLGRVRLPGVPRTKLKSAGKLKSKAAMGKSGGIHDVG